MTNLQACRILGLTLPVTEKELQNAYTQKVASCHPETNPEDWMVLHEAYDQLRKCLNEKTSEPNIQSAPVKNADTPAISQEEWELFGKLEEEIQRQDQLHPEFLGVEDQSSLAEVERMVSEVLEYSKNHQVTQAQLWQIYTSPEFQRLKTKAPAVVVFARLYDLRKNTEPLPVEKAGWTYMEEIAEELMNVPGLPDEVQYKLKKRQKENLQETSEKQNHYEYFFQILFSIMIGNTFLLGAISGKISVALFSLGFTFFTGFGILFLYFQLKNIESVSWLAGLLFLGAGLYFWMMCVAW